MQSVSFSSKKSTYFLTGPKVDFRFLHLDRVNPRMKIEKFEKLVTNLHDKTEYVIHIRNLKQALNHGY